VAIVDITKEPPNLAC